MAVGRVSLREGEGILDLRRINLPSRNLSGSYVIETMQFDLCLD
jgi:hypothetical protein